MCPPHLRHGTGERTAFRVLPLNPGTTIPDKEISGVPGQGIRLPGGLLVEKYLGIQPRLFLIRFPGGAVFSYIIFPIPEIPDVSVLSLPLEQSVFVFQFFDLFSINSGFS